MKKYEVIDNVTNEALIDWAGDTELTIGGVIDEAVRLLEQAFIETEDEGYLGLVKNITSSRDEDEALSWIEGAMEMFDYTVEEVA